MQNFDYIIVGLGVAAFNLAIHLESLGKSFLIVDDGQKTCSSKVAAGVLNPITGKRLVKSWRSEVAMPYANNYYPEIEKLFGEKIFHRSRILQVCKSAEENELWHFRKEDADYASFLSNHLPENQFECVNDNFGSFYIEKVAWLETEKFCRLAKKYVEDKNIYRESQFDYNKLRIEKDFVEYEEIKASAVIFCEGYKAIDNPYFNWLPFSPAKGEILLLKSDAKLPKEIIHKEKWIMKIDDTSFRCGSTWDRENFNQTPTQEGKAEILQAIKRILKNYSELEIESASAGVRPCTRTTRPFLGVHPTIKNLYIFNGFGSKGYALSPYFAKHFTEFLCKNAPLDKEANIERHIKKFFK